MAPEPGFWFPATRRLTRAADLEAVRRAGKRLKTPHLEIRYLASGSHDSRIGIIVPRHQHSAVARNRVKRRLRELCRTRLLPALQRGAAPLDLVVRAFPAAYDASQATLAVEVDQVTLRLGREAT